MALIAATLILGLPYVVGSGASFLGLIDPIKDKSINCYNYESYKKKDASINASLKANSITPFIGSLISKGEKKAYENKFNPPDLDDLQTQLGTATDDFRNEISKLGFTNSENILDLIKTLTGLTNVDAFTGSSSIDFKKGLIGSIAQEIVEPVREMTILNKIDLWYSVIMLGLVIFYILIQ